MRVVLDVQLLLDLSIVHVDSISKKVPLVSLGRPYIDLYIRSAPI